MKGFGRCSAVLALCCLAAGCGTGGSTLSQNSPSVSASAAAPATASAPANASASATASAAVCADASALRSSLEKIGQVSIGKDTASELSGDLSQIKENLDKLAGNAHGQWSPQISSLKSALGDLGTAVSNLADGSGSISAGTAALGHVTTAATSLLSQVSARCAR